LPRTGFLGSLLLQFSGDQVSGLGQSGGNWRLLDYITKIEVVGNGSRIIKDVTGRLAQALAFYDQGVVALDVWRNYASNTQFTSILINFGRFLHDPDYGLLLDDWDNVELRITNAATSSQFAANPTLDVIGFFARPSAEARALGYIRSEVWREWTTVQDAWTYLDMPIEYPIRRIVLQADPDVDDTTNAAETSFGNLMYDIQHYLKTGEVEVFEGRLMELARINAYDYGYTLLTHGHPYTSADKAVDFGIGYPFAHAFMAGSYSGSATSTVNTLTSGQTANTVVFEDGAAGGPREGLVKGMAYHNTGVLRYDWHYDPSTWLNPDIWRTVQLNLHVRNSSSAADGVNRVLLDRLIRR